MLNDELYTDLEITETGLIVLWVNDEKEIYDNHELIDKLNEYEITIKQLKLQVEMLNSVKPTRNLPDRINITVDYADDEHIKNTILETLEDVKKNGGLE